MGVINSFMFRDRYQAGFLNLFYSVGNKALSIWEQHVENGYIKRVTDQETKNAVYEIISTSVNSTFITCPKEQDIELGVKLPVLVLICKFLKKYFTFEIHVLDDTNIRRRFRISNFHSKTTVKPYICTIPIRLDPGWNQLQFNIGDYTKRAYGTNYVETMRISICANCRIRRVYFCDRFYSEDELPAEYRMNSSKGEGED